MRRVRTHNFTLHTNYFFFRVNTTRIENMLWILATFKTWWLLTIFFVYNLEVDSSGICQTTSIYYNHIAWIVPWPKILTWCVKIWIFLFFAGNRHTIGWNQFWRSIVITFEPRCFHKMFQISSRLFFVRRIHTFIY